MPEKFESQPEEAPEAIGLPQDLERTEAAGEPEKGKNGILGPIRRFFGWLKDKREQQKSDVENFRLQSEKLLALIQKKVEIMANPQLSIQKINEEFGERYGLSFPKEDLPEVFVFEGDRTFFAGDINIATADGEKEAKDIIGMKDIYKSLDGGTMSEELAHFYREHLKPKEDKKEAITDEFFGFLGSRLFEKAVEDGSDNLSDIRSESREPLPKKEVLKLSKERRGEARGFQEINDKVREKFGDEAEEKLKIIFKGMIKQLDRAERDKLKKSGINNNDDLIKLAQNQRRDMLVHQRGYEWASKVNMNKISDWKKLFSMPNAEVRKRFFTDKPDYSGL